MERFELLAARDVLAGLGEEEDVGEARRRGCGAEQDEVWGYAFGGPARDDPDHLWQITDEEADEDEAKRMVLALF